MVGKQAKPNMKPAQPNLRIAAPPNPLQPEYIIDKEITAEQYEETLNWFYDQREKDLG